MNVTEKEAKTKRCPYAQSSYWSDKCIASGCMAWHEGLDIIRDLEEVTLPKGDKPEGKIGLRHDYGEEYWVESNTVSSGFSKWTKHRREKGGYCGRVAHP